MNEEAKFYNALNVAMQSEYPAYPELRKLFAEHGSWQKAFKNGNYKINPDAEWEKLEKHDVKLILQNDENFPSLLKEIPWPPFGIYIKGSLPSGAPAVGIVGTRKATAAGAEVAKKFARQLTEQGITVVSGLALGIDESAHKGAVEAAATAGQAAGRTVAVLAVGLERVYPAQNANLAKKILELGGALVSEYPIGSNSYPTRFVERNRIISGLSKGVVVVEAPEKSGALATAKFATDQNREVLVTPGPAGHLNYVGSFKLVRSGAALVNSVEDILDDLNIGLKTPKEMAAAARKKGEFSESQEQILGALESSGEPLNIDKLAELSKMDTPTVSRQLSFLIIKGIIKESGGRYYI